MPSNLAWVDFSDADRERMGELIALFNESATRDELGLGSIRDSLAEQLFPGTSVLQTRARYYLFIPWICQMVEAKRRGSSEFGAYVEDLESKLILSLKAGGVGEGEGLIGMLAGADLDRFPSELFWPGLRSLKILSFTGSRSDYYRQIDSFYKRKTVRLTGDTDGESQERTVRSWDAELPSSPGDFLEKTVFTLSKEEATYLFTRLQTAHPHCYSTFLLSAGADFQKMNWPWDFDRAKLPEHLRILLNNAQLFSLCMHGSAILYNLLLARRRNDVERIADFEAAFASWGKDIAASKLMVEGWSLNEFWTCVRLKNSRIGVKTTNFVEDWINLVRRESDVMWILKEANAEKLISDRELQTKKQRRARLHNDAALSTWNGGAGMNPLSYRWGRVQTILNDISKGLKL